MNRLRAIVVLSLALAGADGLAQSIEWSTVQRGNRQTHAVAGCNGQFEARKPRHMAVAPNGDTVVTGCSHNGNDFEILTVRYSGVTGAVLWSATYAGAYGSHDGAAAVAIDAAGDVVVAGWSREEFASSLDMRTIKYHGATGQQLWTAGHGGSGEDLAYAVATSAAGDVFITGLATSPHPYTSDIRTLKLDGATGATLWSSVFSGANTTADDIGEAIVVDANGDAYVTGSSAEADSGSHFRTLKYDGTTGAQLWTSVFAGYQSNTGLAAVLGPSGGLFVAGYSNTATDGELRVIKYATATGAQVWTAGITGATPGGDLAHSIGVDAAGDVLVTGGGYESLLGGYMRTVKLSGATGTVAWSVAELEEIGNDTAYALAVDSAGNVVVTGRTSDPPYPESFNMRTIKYRGSDGARLWSADYAGTAVGSYDAGMAIGIDADGNVLVAGVSEEIGHDPGFRILKYAGVDGAQLWTSVNPPVTVAETLGQVSVPRFGRIATLGYGRMGNGRGTRLSLFDTANGQALWSVEIAGMPEVYGLSRVAIDAAGDVVIAGHRDGKLNASKFAGASGAPLWSSSLNAAYGAAIALAIDSQGHVVVTGESCPTGDAGACRWDMATVKYNGTTGAEIWSSVIGGSANEYDLAKAIAIDSQDHVIITGRAQDNIAVARTIKHDGSTGAVLWNTASDWGQNGTQGDHVAVDWRNDVLVVTTGATNFGARTRTIKYDGATGVELWGVFYPEGAPSPTGIVVDPSGDLIMSMYDTDTEGREMWRTIRYAGNDGALLWDRTYKGTRPYGFATALALDSLGNVSVAGWTSHSQGLTAHVLKYHGLSGFLLWDLPLTSPPRSGGASTIAIDAAGAIYVGATVTDPGAPNGAMLAKITGGDVMPPNFPSADLDGDGKGDLVWQNSDGRVAVWLMNGTAPQATAEIIGAGTGWSVTHTADFDTGGKSDLLWQHTDGRAAIYLMNGTVPASTSEVSWPSTLGEILVGGGGWSVVHTADVNGDGMADLVVRHVDGMVLVLMQSGGALTSRGPPLEPAGSGWNVTRTADFDADGKDDLLWTHTDGRVAIGLMDGPTEKAKSPILNAGSGWSAIHTPDLNGDAKADIVWQHTDGSVAVWLMDGAAMTSGRSILGPGSGWSVARTADFDGDLRGDLFWENADGRAAIWLMNGTAPKQMTQILNAGSGWSLQHAADLNGDGKSDIAWQNVDGRVAVWLMNGAAMASGAGILGTNSGWSVSTLAP